MAREGASSSISKESAEFLRARRKSISALPFYSIAIMVLGVLFLKLPGWGTAILLGLTLLTLVADVVNIVYCSLKLRKLSSLR